VSYLSTDFTYWYKRKYGLTAGYISTHGSTDKLLYNGGCVTVPVTACSSGGPYTSPINASLPVGVVNSANGDPTTNAWVGELMYAPWLNVKIVLQYTHYTMFNGASNNYDGVGRNASDNDTAYLLMWFAL